jgi:hypothetical protein
MLDTIWSTIMQIIYQRYHEPQKSNVLCNIPWAKFQDRLKDSRRYQVFQSSTGICQVQIPDTGVKYTVNLKENSCSCNNFFQYRGPCAYAIAACRYEAEDPFDHFDSCYSIRKFRRTYEVPIQPMSIEDLPVSYIQPPKLVKKRGRPRTKRIRKNSWKRKSQKCSNCFGLGYNKRRCTNQPGRKNGRGERARDWALDLTPISTPSPLPSGIMSFSSSSLSLLSLDEEEEAGSQAKSTDLELESTSGSNSEVTDESMATKGVAIGKKRGRAVTTARALPARERKLPARYR